MKLLPATYFKNNHSYPAIQLAQEVLNEILRPHLTKHQAKFRKWLENARRNTKNKNLTPQELQRKYPDYIILVNSIKEINQILANTSDKLKSLFE
jgi:hypothetical protein